MPTGPTKLETFETVSPEMCPVTEESLSFNFSNLCGAPYGGGSVVFSPDGNCLYSPVSNRVMVTDLSSNRTFVAVPELRSNTNLLLPMSSGIVLGVDVDGYGMLFDIVSGVVLNRINFKGKVRAAAFSPNGQFLATAVGRRIKVWQSASLDNNWQFVMVRQFAGHIGDVNCLNWASDSLRLISGGSDSIVRVWVMDFVANVHEHSILNEHSQSIVFASFLKNQEGIVAVNRAGSILCWSDKNELLTRASISSGVGYVTCASYHSGILCLGLSGGAFSLYNVTRTVCEPIQSLSVGACVSSVCVHNDWVAVGVEEVGQLIVWEWKSETFICKQQGHFDGVHSVAFCPASVVSRGANDLLDLFANGPSGGIFSAGGGLLATGGVEGKVKLWHSVSGFCFVTLSDHTSSVEGLAFTPQGNAILSASMDGSVRAYDLLRYKNFRTFTAPDARVQFGSIAIDQSGELVAAGAANGSYSIYLWSLQTGQCLDVLNGHEARISNISFSPSGDGGTLVSTSWDSSMRVWSVYAHRNKGGVPESLLTQREVTCSAFDPIDGSILAVATVAGSITFWDVVNGTEVGSIDGLRDIGSGRKDGQKFASGALRGRGSKRDGSGTELNLNQYFSAIQYGGASGRWLAAVSKSSPFLCVYDPLEKNLIKRITLTKNFALSGVYQYLNSKFDLIDSGNGYVVDDYDELDRAGKRVRGQATARALPGVEVGFSKLASARKSWRVDALTISSDGGEIAVATSEGAYVLSTNVAGSVSFQPIALTMDVDHEKVVSQLESGKFANATITALSLGEFDSFLCVFEVVPLEQIASCVTQISPALFVTLLTHLSKLLHPVTGTGKIERGFRWTLEFIKLRFIDVQAEVFTNKSRLIRAALCSILQNIQTHSGSLGALLRENSFMLGFLANRGIEQIDDQTIDSLPVHLDTLTQTHTQIV